MTTEKTILCKNFGVLRNKITNRCKEFRNATLQDTKKKLIFEGSYFGLPNPNFRNQDFFVKNQEVFI